MGSPYSNKAETADLQFYDDFKIIKNPSACVIYIKKIQHLRG